MLGASDANLYVPIPMYLQANQTQRPFDISTGGLEGISIDGQWSTQNHQRRAVLRSADGLIDGQATNCLHRHLHRAHNVTELIQRTGHAPPHGCNATTLIKADVMND